MRLTLRGARLVDAFKDIARGEITLEGTQIQAVQAGEQSKGLQETKGTVVDATDMIVIPGFIDVHTHGGGGFQLHTTDVREIRSYANWVASTGVTAFLIAVVGTPGQLPKGQLTAAVAAIDSHEEGEGAEPLGIHMEGPYMNVKRRGAHPPEWLRLPDADETESFLELTNGHLRLITLAPELPGAETMIRRLVEAGVTVSMGHTDATYEQALEAVQLGVSHVTHCFNAMSSLHHRNPGPLAAVAQTKHVRGELIADGMHVHPSMMNVLVKLLGPERTIVITDALAGAGLPDAIFEFAGQTVQVICGVARLSDGTMSGSVLTMDQALRNVLEMTEVSLQEAVRMLTFNPAQSIQVSERKGRLQAGYDADLVVLDSSLALQATICRGSIAFVTDAWRERLSVDR